MGDIILTTPLLKILKKNFPHAEIHYCTRSSYADLLRFNPNITKLIQVNDDISFNKLKELRKKLSAEKYDLIIDLHKSLRTFYLSLFLRFRTKIIKFRKYSVRKFLLVKFKLNLMKDLPPIMRRYVDTLTKVGIDTVKIDKDLFRTEIFTDDPSKERVKIILEKKKVPEGKKIICIAPSSKHFTKTYPADYYTELIKKFDKEKYCIVMIGKGEDNKNIEEVLTKTNSNVFNLCDELNLLELAELMKRTALVISGDTGPMHIAEAMQIPLVVIAGSSVREFGFYPQSERAEVLENNGLTCRPCSHIGRDKCPKGHFKCMKDITPEMVFEKCKKLMYQS